MRKGFFLFNSAIPTPKGLHNKKKIKSYNLSKVTKSVKFFMRTSFISNS